MRLEHGRDNRDNNRRLPDPPAAVRDVEMIDGNVAYAAPPHADPPVLTPPHDSESSDSTVFLIGDVNETVEVVPETPRRGIKRDVADGEVESPPNKSPSSVESKAKKSLPKLPSTVEQGSPSSQSTFYADALQAAFSFADEMEVVDDNEDNDKKSSGIDDEEGKPPAI